MLDKHFMTWDSNVKWQSGNDLINVEKDTNKSGLEAFGAEKYKHSVKSTFEIIHEIEDLGIPEDGEQIRFVTFKSFNGALFLNHICETEIIEHLYMSVYSFNYDASVLVNDLINEGKIKRATILMSNLRNKAHREKEQMTRDMLVDNPNVDLFFASSHAKIMAMKTQSGNHFVLEGSGNLSFNSRIEQYCFDNNKGLFEFTEKWMREIKVFLEGRKELVLT